MGDKMTETATSASDRRTQWRTRAFWGLVGVLVPNLIFLWYNIFYVVPDLRAQLIGFDVGHSIDSTLLVANLDPSKGAEAWELWLLVKDDPEPTLFSEMRGFVRSMEGVRFTNIGLLIRITREADSLLASGKTKAHDTLSSQQIMKFRDQAEDLLSSFKIQQSTMRDSLVNSSQVTASVIVSNGGRAGGTVFPEAVLRITQGAETFSVPMTTNETDFPSHTTTTVVLRSPPIVDYSTGIRSTNENVGKALRLLNDDRVPAQVVLAFMSFENDVLKTDTRNFSKDILRNVREDLERALR